jgi:hypothetical protein
LLVCSELRRSGRVNDAPGRDSRDGVGLLSEVSAD